ncbi:MAG: hypothetical protein R3E67_04995 [Pseudomonadales bacterium]
MGTILVQAFFQGVLVVVVTMEQLGPTRLGAVMATVPAFAGIGAVFFLGEPFHGCSHSDCCSLQRRHGWAPEAE